jgi:hypothetical protein
MMAEQRRRSKPLHSALIEEGNKVIAESADGAPAPIGNADDVIPLETVHA